MEFPRIHIFRTIGLFVSILMGFAVSHVDARIIEVGKNPRHSGIATAILQASDHDTILIQKGNYVEDLIVVDKPLTLKGIDFPTVQNKNNEEVILVTSDYVVIEGLSIENVKHSYIRDFSGIRLKEAKRCTVRNNRLINTFFGIYLQNSDSCIIQGNIVKGQAEQEMSSGNAIHLWYCKEILIKDNDINQHRDGIYLEFVKNSTIINNKSIENIRYGLHFMFSNHNTYLNNTFQNNGTGVAVMYSDHIVMKGNLFKDNWSDASFGILLKDIKDSEIMNNLFDNNTSAIFMDNSMRIVFSNNTVQKNGWGIKIRGSCSENTFYGNNFSNNTFDVSTESKESDNSFAGNYWNKYKGYDLDKDGTGDVAYNPVTLSSYVVSNYPASIILLRSLCVDVLDMVEKITPVFVPTDLIDPNPLMKIPAGL